MGWREGNSISSNEKLRRARNDAQQRIARIVGIYIYQVGKSHVCKECGGIFKVESERAFHCIICHPLETWDEEIRKQIGQIIATMNAAMGQR